MSATIDLFVLNMVVGAEGVPLYEPHWLFANYASTGGLWRDNTDGPGMHIEDTGVGMIIEALFGDGPQRYGFTTVRPVVLADYNYKKQKAFRFASRKYPRNRHIVLRTKMMERVRLICEEKERHPFYAFSLEEFNGLIARIPRADMDKGANGTRPMNAFLADLDPRGQLILPIIGGGIVNQYDPLWHFCGYSSAIVSPRFLD